VEALGSATFVPTPAPVEGQRDIPVESPVEAPVETPVDPSINLAFTSTEALQGAVDSYMIDSSAASSVAQTYGHPIGAWDVSQITDFSQLFDVDRNPAAASFNEDISGWNVMNASTMWAMFYNAAAFN